MTERFSASRAAQLMACPGSANLDLSIPGWNPPVVDEEKGRKSEGHFIHEILEHAGQLTPRDMLHTAEAMLYVAELRRKRRFKILLEEPIVAEWLPSKPKTTVDVVLYVADEMHILDYKTGKIPVYAEDNVQQLFYARSFAYLAPKAPGVWIHIVQPWAPDGNSVWFASADRLAEFSRDAIAADEKILAGDTALNPSDDCKFCPANPHSRSDKGRPLCPAMMQVLGYGMTVDEASILAL